MCDPVTIATVMAVTATVSQGYAAKKQGKYQNQVAKYNARVQENEAEETIAKGVEEENIQREKTAKLLARQRAELGASGVGLTTGSPLDIQEETELLGEVDALRIKSNFQKRAVSLGQQAELTKATGEAAESTGKQEFASSLLQAGGQFLSSGVADKWFTPDSAGIPTPRTSTNLKSTTRPSVPGIGTF